MKEIPFHLYIDTEVDCGVYYNEIPGQRILKGICEWGCNVTIYYPSFEHAEMCRDVIVPKESCKLILRSIDEDLTQEEELHIEKMGYFISRPRNYILDKDGSDIRLRIQAAADLICYLIQQKFSVGVLSQNDYIIKPIKKI